MSQCLEKRRAWLVGKNKRDSREDCGIGRKARALVWCTKEDDALELIVYRNIECFILSKNKGLFDN